MVSANEVYGPHCCNGLCCADATVTVATKAPSAPHIKCYEHNEPCTPNSYIYDCVHEYSQPKNSSLRNLRDTKYAPFNMSNIASSVYQHNKVQRVT